LLLLPPTPNPLINALKPTHCAGWVYLISYNSKTRDPWNAVHGLLFPPTSTGAFATFVLLSGGCKSAGAHPTPFSYSFFYFPLIDMGLFKDRGVAMGKPHCNSSICNFRFCT